jgi:hypothetical protein
MAVVLGLASLRSSAAISASARRGTISCPIKVSDALASGANADLEKVAGTRASFSLRGSCTTIGWMISGTGSRTGSLSTLIASKGHVSIQISHSVQAASSITALPAEIRIASVGHAFTHVPQPVHKSGLMLITIKYSLYDLDIATTNHPAKN